MSLSRSCTPCLKRPRTFALPFRPVIPTHARRTYASQGPTTTTTPPSSTSTSTESTQSQPQKEDVKKELGSRKPKRLSTDEFLAKARHTMANREALTRVDNRNIQPDKGQAGRGKLAPGSIFDDETLPLTPGHGAEKKAGQEAPAPPPLNRSFEVMQNFMSPRPPSTRRWLRKMVARRVRRRGQLTELEIRKRTERELRATSEFWKVSIKKLAPLARLIAGKTLNEALVQMRFSKKMAARKIYSFLVETRDRAIVERGMSIGEDLDKPVTIGLKNGKKRAIENPSEIYVDQAWVGQGPYGRSPLYRARGRMDMMRHPTTSFSVLLKEEKTRMREHNDRQDRELARKPWVQMPNRPITAQRPYYSW